MKIFWSCWMFKEGKCRYSIVLIEGWKRSISWYRKTEEYKEDEFDFLGDAHGFVYVVDEKKLESINTQLVSK